MRIRTVPEIKRPNRKNEQREKMREWTEGVRKGVTLILTQEAGRDEKKGLCTRITLHLEMKKKKLQINCGGKERIQRVSRPTACSLYFFT